ncbi:guanylate cyclase [Chloropicon primus]|uniref:Guanylate cyclase n=1 Tax=Chloropicon primus TaxID=1764295 RepID=A0A5B8MY92_9CHLO|nr:guanylate cyclase [Chloropicon primus]UPR04780.1 guanylate cyclase [Chloropicon primus]|eukprot:QDZ25583.1 guanylate cyclase [Chloropicon primus]
MSGSLKLSNILPEEKTDDNGKPTVHASGIEELINWHHKQASIADFSYHVNNDHDSILSLGTLVIIRYAALLPLGVMLLLLSTTKTYQHYIQYAISIFNFIFGTGLSAMAVLGGDYAGYGPVFMFVFYTFFLSKSRFFKASVSTLCIIGAHYAFLYVKSEDDLGNEYPKFNRPDWNRKIFNDVGVLLLLDICCMYGSYVQENTLRGEFLNAVIVQLEAGKMNHLLHNLLPSSAVKALRSGTQAIADEFPVATVLFSDIVGFTKLSGDKHPSDICILLHNLYCVFDRLTDIYGVYKVETIGDAYEAVSGLDMNDDSVDDRKLTQREITLKSKINAASITNFGLSMLEQIPIINSTNNYPVNIRIGIHSGPIIAGVIGMKMPRYHLWGETVATAEHLEAGGVEGAIQVSSYTKTLLEEYFILQRRGWIEIKGHEDKKMETYLLIGPKEGGNDSITKQIEKAREKLQNLVQERVDELKEQEEDFKIQGKKSKKVKFAKRASLPVFGSIRGDLHAQTTKFGKMMGPDDIDMPEEKLEPVPDESGKFTTAGLKEMAQQKQGQGKTKSKHTQMALRKHTRRRTTFFKQGQSTSMITEETEDEKETSYFEDNHQDQSAPINVASLGDRVVQLPRGGVMVRTAIGNIQFGIPPETIKDAMLMKMEAAKDIRDKMPVCYVIPHQLFDQKCGICMAEVEFPTYFNFFVLGRKPTFLTYPSVERRLRKVLRETLVGPSTIDYDIEYSENFPKECRSDVVKECASLRTFDDPDQLMEFIHFDKTSGEINITSELLEKLKASGSKNIDSSVEVVIKDVVSGFEVRENGETIARIPTKIATESHALKKILNEHVHTPSRKFDPPLFGVTILGSSHGFDPNRTTTGFVLWMNRRGIMVDPPLNSVALLESYGIPARLIDAVMVTHCHADHDGGTLQKILAETQCTVITTTAILNSFIRKYSLLTNLEEEFLQTLFIARPAIVGEPILINGGEINVFYTMHTIPAIGIVAKFCGKTIYYSGDTCNDVELIEKMHKEGVMSNERKDMLLQQTWDYSLILHECGVPPIHTPVRSLSSLPEDVKERMWLVHIAEKDVPNDLGLKLAREGVENTLVLDIEAKESGDAVEVLELLETIPFFKGIFMTGDRARDILQLAQNVKFSPGSLICKEGDRVDNFFIIRLGIVNIDSDMGKIHSKAYSGDYFGECCLLPGHLSNVDISALTDVEAISISGKDLQQMLDEMPEASQKITKMLDMQAFGFLDTLLCNTMFKDLTSVQKTNLMSIAERYEINQGDVLWDIGDVAQYCIINLSATIQLTIEVEKTKTLKFGVGSILGDMNALLDSESLPCVTKAECIRRGMAFKIKKENFMDYIAKNPGLRMWCINRLYIDSVHSLNRNVSRRQSISIMPEESLLDSVVKGVGSVIGNMDETNEREDTGSVGSLEVGLNDDDIGDIPESPFSPKAGEKEKKANNKKEAFPGSREDFPGMRPTIMRGKKGSEDSEDDEEEIPDGGEGLLQSISGKLMSCCQYRRNKMTRVIPIKARYKKKEPGARRGGGRMELSSIKLESFTNNVSQITNRIFKGAVSWVGHSMEASLAECMVEGVVLKNTNINGITLLFDYDRAESLFQLRLSNEIPWRRFNITCLLFFIATLGLYDYVIRKDSALESLLLVRYLGALPLTVIWLAFSFTQWYTRPKAYTSVSMLLATLLGIACSFLSVVGKEPGYGGIMLYILFCGFFLRLRSVVTIPLLYIIAVLHTSIVGYFVIADQIAKPWLEFKEEHLFWSLGYVMTFASLVNYMVFTMEYNQRKDFLGELGQKLERQKSHIVLNNMLPEAVAKELYGATVFPICHEFKQVTLVFCSIDSFEKHVTKVLDSVQVVELLNTIFFVFDILVDRHQLYKVETVGDMYLAASGMPKAKNNHAQLVANFVSQLLILKTDDWVPRENNKSGLDVKINFGMSSGPVTAGIIGVHRPFYHIFGDTVNTASRMISTGIPGTCQMTEASQNFLKGGNYKIRERGDIQVKGKGIMHTYFLEGSNENVEHHQISHLVKEKRKSLLRTFAEGEEDDVVANLPVATKKVKKKRSRFISMQK